MRPFDAFSCDKMLHRFFIPDCQNLTQIRQINKLANLFFEPHFTNCLLENGGINDVQVLHDFGHYEGPELDSHGKIKQDPFQNLHVINAENVQQLVDKEGICPICCKKVDVLVSCPLMELKLKYCSIDIPWEQEKILSKSFEKQLIFTCPSALDAHQEFSLVHLVFLLELAWCKKDPQTDSIPDGIITKFFESDGKYAEQIWESLRSELNIEKSRSWIHYLKKQHDLAYLRKELYGFLCQHIKADHDPPYLHSKKMIDECRVIDRLREVRDSFNSHQRNTIPIFSMKHKLQLIRGKKSISVRYLLLGGLFLFTFAYFFCTIFISFLKRKFLFGEDI